MTAGAGAPLFDDFACIDWSGARGERLKGLAVAMCAAGDRAPALIGPPAGGVWSRAAMLDWIVGQRDRRMLIGLDLSMSFPFADAGAFLPDTAARMADARSFWAHVEDRSALDDHHAAGGFVAAYADHFRIPGRTGASFGTAGNGRLRLTEVRAQAMGLRPASCFNLVGPAQVGLSSLTGMRVLHRLSGRVPIWPFDPIERDGAALVEVYTGLAARAAGVRGGTKLRTVAALNAALTSPAIGSRPIDGDGAISDHASDALLTAAWLRRAAARAELWHPPGLDAVRDQEGWTFGVT